MCVAEQDHVCIIEFYFNNIIFSYISMIITVK